MDAHLFRRFCEAAEPLLVGSRVEKVQEAGPSLLVISLYGNGQKRQFCLRHDRKEPLCFFAGSRLTAGAPPSAQVMRLRKYMVGRRIAATVAQFWQRRLWFLLSGAAEKEGGALPAGTALWLLLDLREGPSLHFQRPEGAPGPAPGLPLPPEPDGPDAAHWPEPAQLADALGHWRDWPVLTPALRRSLVHMEEPDQWALMEDLRAGGGDVFLYTDAGDGENGPVRAVSAWPLPPGLGKGLVEEAGCDVAALVERAARSLVLGRLAEAREAERARPVQRRLRKIAKLLEKLDAEEERLKAMTSRQADALALSANLWRWEPDFRAEAVELPDETSEPGAPRRIRLDPRHGLRANMERLFHAAKRGKRGLEMLAPRRAALLAEAESLRQAAGHAEPGLSAPADDGATASAPLAARLIPRELPRRVQAFVSEDGFLLLRGRDARGNQALLRKAAPGDIWLHAEGGPGAHVLIRRAHAGQEVPERTLEQAGCLAASKSWRRDAASARILYAEARHVRPLRGAAPGTVRMDKILATREVAVDPELENRLVHS